jgi:hypothetical protein
MAIYKTPYETTVGSGANTERVIHPLQEYLINHPYETQPGISNDPIRLVYFSANDKDADLIPSFAHPMFFEIKKNSGVSFLAVDVRPVVSRLTMPSQPLGGMYSSRIRNSGEFLFMSVRAIMSKMWLEGSYALLRDISHVPCAIYSSWISEAVANRFGLDAADRTRIQIMAALFYQTLFTETGLSEETDRQKMAYAASKATRAPIDEIFTIADKIAQAQNGSAFANINDFCNATKEVIENERMQMFNAGILTTVLANTWFGVNAKEVAPCALEHPPTWISLVFTSFQEKSFKNSNISNISKRFAGNKGEVDFVKAFFAMYTSNGGFKDMPSQI